MPGILRIEDVAFEVDHDRSQFFAYVPQEPPGQPSSGRLHWSPYHIVFPTEGLKVAAHSTHTSRRNAP